VIADWLMWSLMIAGWELCLLYKSRWAEPRFVVAAVSADWSAKGAECDWLAYMMVKSELYSSAV
jgi:hypothetical protein